MRYLLIDTNYPGFLEGVYANRPGLRSAPYSEQLAAIHAGLFGEAPFEVAALRQLGHEAEVVVANALPAQSAWAREHGVALPPSSRLNPAVRRHVVPWIRREQSVEWMWIAVLAQVRAYRPDVVQIQMPDFMPPEIVRAVRDEVRLVIGQLAAPLPSWPLQGFDLMISSLPNLVEAFRGQGLAAEWIPLAFEPSLLQRIPAADRDVPVSFVGSVSPHHASRLTFLREVATRLHLQIWTADRTGPEAAGIPATFHPAVWGRQMYEVLGRSLITINNHIDVAGNFANNLRLYEATGMGALLVTDAKQNLSQLFEVGREVVAYRDARECAELIAYYLDRPSEAADIVRAGQRRTLRDHTWLDRMARLAEFAEART